jgi:hypothetical protein
MKLKLALASATALGLMMGAAWAGNSNTLYISQSGSGNAADVHQSGAETYHQASSGNDIGTQAVPAVQTGTDNTLIYTNAGYGSGNDNDIVKLRQDGTGNWFYVTDSNGATSTRISNVLQQGTNNQASVTRAGEQSSTIGSVLMDGSNNNVWIRQGPIYRTGLGYGPAGGGNTIALVKVKGDNNGIAYTNSPGNPYSAGIWIEQTGSAVNGGIYNNITEASIEGSNNPSHFGHAISIYQEGSYNGRTASIARMKGSNGNDISVSEVGDWNNFDIREGVSASSTGNFTQLTQTGSFNSAAATQFGDSNTLTVTQNGYNNSSTTNFDGDGNGRGTLTGAAGALDAASSDLTEGVVLQDTGGGLAGNTLTYNVHGSNNLFAFAQLGGGNTITGTVGSAGHDSNGNQAAVLQTGSSNSVGFTQTGIGGNVVAVSQ